jgi:hypothetical protein
MKTNTIAQRIVNTFFSAVLAFSVSAEPLSISGVYPHLTMFNNENECGTGAVVPWQGSLWAITYAPHAPNGSSDKLYEITEDLEQIIFKDSVGGTPANRMIHRKSDQLLIGPYQIDNKRQIRVLPPSKIFGRLTGTAHHLTDPDKVYHATMEQGLYEVDVNTLEVICHIRDRHAEAPEEGVVTMVPGAHGKGLYSGQDRVVFSNNGEKGPKNDPTVTSGVLAQWFGEGDWEKVRRNQFTEITGPGGIYGNEKPDTDPIWAMGWDARSVILALLEDREWHYYRLPKGSHSYDGSHGWNTEWPRIREIGEDDLLGTMHGTFWRFPATFSRSHSGGIAPRSNYLKVIGDFCRWNDRIVLGCDDSARAEFLNKRSFKAAHGAPLQSNSNLWFIDPERLDDMGPVIGRGSVWLRDDLELGQVSDPYLFSGYDYRQLHLTHGSEEALSFVLEVDREGNNQWAALREFTVKPQSAVSHIFSVEEKGAWVRIRSLSAAKNVTANFQYRNVDPRSKKNDALFAGMGTEEAPAESFGLMRSLAYDRLGIAASLNPKGEGASYYELNPQMELVPIDDPDAVMELVEAVRQPTRAVSVDAASVLIIEEGKRYRLPKSPSLQDSMTEVGNSLEATTLDDFLNGSLTKGADVKVSSQHLDYAADNAVDGRLSDESRWIGKNDGDMWIELDLGEAKMIRSLWVVTGWKNEKPYVATDFDVQTKVDGEWQTIPNGKIRGNSKIQRKINLTDPLTTQHLRLVASGGSYLRVYELAAFDHELGIEQNSSSEFGIARVCREVATERDLLNVSGTFYELPAQNAQGMAKVRPIASHNLKVHDFCSHNGLLFFTGIDGETESEHVFRSSDGKAAVWAGVIDDLWKLGKPRGIGGPWKDSAVKAGMPSDPYLMTGYDKKLVELTSSVESTITLEVDIDGTGLWIPYKNFKVAAGEIVQHSFPKGFSAYWVRAISEVDAVVTVSLDYR